MYPILLKIHLMGRSIPIGTYGLFMITAAATGIIISLFMAKRHGYSLDEFFNYAMIIIAFVIGGAWLAGFLLFLPERIGQGFWEYPPVLVSWGGIAGGVGALFFIKINYGEEFLHLADICTPGYLAGIGIGRIGCFFGGCCYGVYATRFGITFTDPLALASAASQPLVPTQLISAGFLAVAALIFIKISSQKLITGIAFAASAMVYSVFRFTIEFWRDDPRIFLLGLSDGQIFSCIYFLSGLIILMVALLRRYEEHGGKQASEKTGFLYIK